ncbi:MAG: ribosome small subunit-dependent GTPase A [Clostridiales bacterium]|nr:ribosome small subunit-dependent GTPase A [Clostridiales bacterium]
MNGLITKSIGGIYYVEAPNGLYSCKARGVFRKRGTTPLVGDRVEIDVTDEFEGVITKVHERKNELVRPPLANLDQLILVVSTCEPIPNLLILDKLIAIAEHKGIEPIIVITKIDLDEHEPLQDIYSSAGFDVYISDNIKGDNVDGITALLEGKISGFAGNTGVGKSSLLNAIDGTLSIETGEISKKLGRGRHTTRHAELYKLDNGGYIADTPGFSALETGRYDIILKDDLEHCFREFAPYLGQCKFRDCAHIKAKSCAIQDAVEKGEIEKTRYESYVLMYGEAQQIKEWEL